MMGDCRVKTPVFITGDEIISLAANLTADTMIITDKLRKQFCNYVWSNEGWNGSRWERMKIDSMIFEAGRLQGFREARRKNKKNK